MWRLILKRDISLAFRNGGGAMAGISFYLMVYVMFAFALGPQQLAISASSILTLTLLLSTIISLPFLYERDHEDGTLELYMLQPLTVEWLACAKILAYWAAHALPLVLLAPVLAAFAGAPAESIYPFMLRLALASFAIVSTGSLGAALTLNQRRGALLRALILLPLYIPVLIFAVTGMQELYPTLLVAAWSCMMLPLSCLVSGVLLRLANH